MVVLVLRRGWQVGALSIGGSTDLVGYDNVLSLRSDRQRPRRQETFGACPSREGRAVAEAGSRLGTSSARWRWELEVEWAAGVSAGSAACRFPCC